MAQLKELKAIRPFIYSGKDYKRWDLFNAPEPDAAGLVVKNCAVYVPVSPYEGETKELKKVTRSKPKRK